jgi:uncharacterized protein YjeT (DUF2065 family)
VIEKVFFGLASIAVFEGLVLAIATNRLKKAIILLENISPTYLSQLGLFLLAIGILVMSLINV